MPAQNIRMVHNNQKNSNTKQVTSYQLRAAPIKSGKLMAQSSQLKNKKWKSKKQELVVVKKL
jgi:hypothetical protein